MIGVQLYIHEETIALKRIRQNKEMSFQRSSCIYHLEMKQATYCSKCCTLNIINLFQEFIIPSTGEKGQRRCRVQVYGRWRRRREGEWRRSATQQAHHVQTWAGGLAMSMSTAHWAVLLWNGECDVGWRIEDQWRWWAGQRLLQILHMNYEIDDGVGLEAMIVDLHKPAG